MSQSYGFLIPIAMILCIGGFVVAMFVAIFFFAVRSVQGVNRTWGALGISTGLILKPGTLFSQPELNGTFRQRPIRLYAYSVGSGRYRQTYTAVALTIQNQSNSTLEITPSGTVGNLLGKMVKAQDVEIGSNDFDGRFVIKSDPPDFAVRVLGEARLQGEMMEIQGMSRIELQGVSLKYSKRGLEDNGEFLTKVVNTLSDLADRIEALQ